jgi:hypothetical protein
MSGSGQFLPVENGPLLFASISCQFFHTQNVRRNGKKRKENLVVPTSIQTAVSLSMHFAWPGAKMPTQEIEYQTN